MGVERSELRLMWPADLFAREAQALLDERYWRVDDFAWLLAEAFADSRGQQLLQETGAIWRNTRDTDPWGDAPEVPQRTLAAGGTLVAELIRDAEQLPRYERPRYWSARQRPTAPRSPLTLPEVKETYAAQIVTLAEHGYFDDAFGSSCPDARDGADGNGQRRLAELLESDGPLWPLSREGERTRIEQQWPDEVFFDVVEALHDVVARPRSRSWHDYHDGWDYSDFARFPGRAVYRWKVNELLANSELGLRIADSGTDLGRLVRAATDDRAALVTRVLEAGGPVDQAAVSHAVALFRRRGASREEMRSAVVALARLLEDRRSLLQAELLNNDEGALFAIANKFDLRHRRADQQSDYDVAFLEWTYWWYLATVELTNQLISRQAVKS